MKDSGTLTRSVGHSTNMVGLPTDLLASAMFNEAAPDLRVWGVREMNRGLFEEMLPRAPDLESAGEAFHKYMVACFGLDPEQQERVREKSGSSARRFRSSYLRLLKGWGYDSNAKEGAVMKGWVESRFGLIPTFHKERLDKFSSPAWMGYVEEKMSSRFHNNSIHVQLDIMYEFCQWALRRFVAPGQTTLPLYRGCNDFSEHPVIERRDKSNLVVRMNSLISFTSDRTVADCFGDTILEARVPLCKIIFFNTLLPAINPLKGESEYLVIGGDYMVKASYF